MRLPIVRLIASHKEERSTVECEKAQLLKQQHDIARRVHILEWWTFPHRDHPQGRHDH